MNLREEGFWDQHYETELKNFLDDGDEGEVWFGRGLSRKIAAQIVSMIKDDHYYDGLEKIKILDIGCGNAFFLTTLADKVGLDMLGDKATKLEYLGLDYSTNSIELSRRIVSTKRLDTQISLKVCDFLDLEAVNQSTGCMEYEFVVDVGTFDAICLLASGSDDAIAEARQAYLKSLGSVVHGDTVFLFASCNHTKDELLGLFDCESPLKQSITLLGEIETPKLQFGGKEGSQVCCLLIKFSTS